MHPEIPNMFSYFGMSESINYFIDIVTADEEARRDFKFLSESSYQLFKQITCKILNQSLVSLCNCHFYQGTTESYDMPSK